MSIDKVSPRASENAELRGVHNRKRIVKKSNVANCIVPALAVTICVMGISAALSAHDARGNSTISRQRAIAIALSARPGVITAEALEGRDDVTGLRYSFDIREGSQSYEVDIDAMDGTVLEIVSDTQNPH
jgi:uncharacterized membrane protein YkoI